MFSKMLSFVENMTPQVGLLNTIGTLTFIVVILYIYKSSSKKDKMIADLLDRLEAQAMQANETIGKTIDDIKDLSNQTIKELSGLATQIESALDIIKTLLIYRDVMNPEPEPPKPKPKKAKKKGGEE